MSNSNIAEYGKFTRFQPGVSGNKKGRPKGARNMATLARELLNDEKLANKVIARKPDYWWDLQNKNFASAIVTAMIVRALSGDVSAATWLRTTGFGSKSG